MNISTYQAQTRLWRTYRVLTRKGFRADKADRLLKTLSDEQLRIAVANPDHAGLGEAAAAALLSTRTNPQGPTPDLIAPTFLTRADLDKILPRGVPGLHQWFGRLGLGLAVIFGVLAFLAFAPLADLRAAAFSDALRAGVLSADEMAKQASPISPGDSDTFGDQYLKEPRLQPYAEPYLKQNMLGGALFVSALAAGAVAVYAAMFRRRPARILLLRKFNNADIDRRLSRFVKKNLSPLGHVFTLSDKYFKRPIFSIGFFLAYWSPLYWAPMLILVPWDFVRGRLDRSSIGGQIRVWSARDFSKLATRVTDRVSCNTQVMATARRAVLVRTSDAWWKQVIRLLMVSADAIVVDLSDVTAGTEWELDRVVEFGFLPKTVFIVRRDADGAIAQTAELLGRIARHGALNPTVWKEPKKATDESRHAAERMGINEQSFAPLAFRDNGKPVDVKELRRRLRDALEAGVTGIPPTLQAPRASAS